VQVSVQSLGNKKFDGQVARFTSRVNHDTRTMITEIEVPNPNLELIPGMYAAAAFRLEQRPHALAIPIEAVSFGGNNTVYVVNTAGEIEERPVALGLVTSTRCEVASGLNEGEMVMIGARSAVHPGEKVEAKPWQPPALP
jgi:multidrug efflux pump subunit AcrA (membrane-fusion protein)